MDSHDNSFAGQTFGADELSAISSSFSATKHPRISKQSPFYRMNEPRMSSEQKPRLRLNNKENQIRQPRKPILVQRLPTSPSSGTLQDICHDIMGMYREQKRLYEALLNRPGNKCIISQLEQLHTKFNHYTKLL